MNKDLIKNEITHIVICLVIIVVVLVLKSMLHDIEKMNKEITLLQAKVESISYILDSKTKVNE